MCPVLHDQKRGVLQPVAMTDDQDPLQDPVREDIHGGTFVPHEPRQPTAPSGRCPDFDASAELACFSPQSLLQTNAAVLDPEGLALNCDALHGLQTVGLFRVPCWSRSFVCCTWL